MKWWTNLKKKLCQHDPEVSIVLEEGELCEPGGQPRKVKIRIVYIKCLKCNRILRAVPKGVAHDPAKGIFQKDEANVTQIQLSNDEKKQLMEELL